MSSRVLIKIFEEIKSKKSNINSLLIIRNGYIVVEANRNHPEVLHPIYSSTKSVVSAIFGIALSKGYIKNIDQSFIDYFPELSQKKDKVKKASITLKDLPTMSSGFEWPEARMGYNNSENPAIEMFKSPDTVQYILDKPVTQQPGQSFNYNSGCSHLLLAAINRTGLNVGDFANEFLFLPLGITLYSWGLDSNGLQNSVYGLGMTTRDMAKIGYLYLKGGTWNGKQIIPKTWVEESTTKQMKLNWGAHYGYQWYIHSFGFHSLGFRGQYIIIIPKQELIVVFTSSLPQSQILTPIDLVKSFVIPAVKSSRSLPEDEKAMTILNSKSKKLEIN